MSSINWGAVGAGLLLVVASIAGVAGLGAAAATDYTKDYSADGSVLVSNETAVTDDLATVYSDVTAVSDINGDGTTTTSTAVRFEIHGINETSDATVANSSVLVNETRTINQGNTETFDFEPTETQNSDYESYYLHVEMAEDGTSDSGDILEVDHGALYSTSGALGGGGGLGGLGVGTPVLAAAVIGGAALLMMKD